MTARPSADEIKSRTTDLLKGTQFECTDLVPLTGGTANFIYKARLVTPLADGTSEVAIKHGEGYIASSPDFALTTDRCKVEAECLKVSEALQQVTADAPESSSFLIVRTPKVYMYDDESKTMVQEYLPNGVNLKDYALKHFSSPTPESLRPQCLEIGKALAEYIAEFHQRTRTDTVTWRESDGSKPEPELHRVVKNATDMQSLKHLINNDWLIQRIDQFPAVLGEARPVFEKVKQMALDELKGDLSPIHGDYWTGNILITDTSIEEAKKSPIFVTDWEMSHLGVQAMDHGQMLAEMYLLYHYKGIDAGLWMMEGYRSGMGDLVFDDDIWRSLIHLGGHLISFGTVTPGWGTQEQAEQLARVGRDFIVMAWDKDVTKLSQSSLAFLIHSASSWY